VGTYKLALTLTDSGTPPATTPANYPIVIANPPPPIISTTPAPSAGAISLSYSFAFTVTGGLLPLGLWSETGPLPPGLLFNSRDGVLSGTPTAAGIFPISVMVQDAAGQSSAPQDFNIQIFAHGFQATNSMASSRFAHAATLLNNGKVLVTGGLDASGNTQASAEIYDPTSGSFSSTGSMGTARQSHTATLLSSGKVLVTGGLDSTQNPLATAEIYDTSLGTFSPAPGNMQIARASHTATLLNSGKVLIAGWGNATAELFDPATGIFAPTGSMLSARVSHTATLLNTGKVLLTGGIQGAPPNTTVLAESELYDPGAGTFSQTLSSLATAREWHTACLLPDGKVLVTGGLNRAGNAISSVELFDPSSEGFTPAKGNMETARAFHTSTALKDGTVLVTGGDDGIAPLGTAEVYDPTTGVFSPTGSMGTARQSHTATLLSDGKVLIIGGANGIGALATAERYQ
jgi:WD40 repeat protein